MLCQNTQFNGPTPTILLATNGRANFLGTAGQTAFSEGGPCLGLGMGRTQFPGCLDWWHFWILLIFFWCVALEFRREMGLSQNLFDPKCIVFFFGGFETNDIQKTFGGPTQMVQKLLATGTQKPDLWRWTEEGHSEFEEPKSKLWLLKSSIQRLLPDAVASRNKARMVISKFKLTHFPRIKALFSLYLLVGFRHCTLKKHFFYDFAGKPREISDEPWYTWKVLYATIQLQPFNAFPIEIDFSCWIHLQYSALGFAKKACLFRFQP